jgi:hypothetical protein
MSEKINAVDFFPLNGFGEKLAELTDPDPDFEPDDSWEQRYNMYSLAGGGTDIGDLKIARKKKAGRAELSIDYRKNTAGKPALLQQAEVEVNEDLLASPRSWSLFYRAEKAPGNLMPETEIRKSGKCSDRGMQIATGGLFRDERVDGPYALNWPLFEAVQRMPREEGFQTELFTLFDHFDQRKESQQIKYWKAVDAAFPDGRTLRLHAFEHIGRGVLPIYYWVSDAGQLMAAISGIEGYLLTRAKRA